MCARCLAAPGILPNLQNISSPWAWTVDSSKAHLKLFSRGTLGFLLRVSFPDIAAHAKGDEEAEWDAGHGYVLAAFTHLPGPQDFDVAPTSSDPSSHAIARLAATAVGQHARSVKLLLHPGFWHALTQTGPRASKHKQTMCGNTLCR